MFTVQVDASKINVRLEEMPPQVRAALTVAVFTAAGELAGLAQSKASGELLQVRTGKFARSIKPWIRTKENSVQGGVRSRDPRANLFEWGGTTPPHDIAPKNAKALLLQVRTGKVFAGRVHHPGGKYEPRRIIHSAFDEMKPQIEASLEEAVLNAADRVVE